MYLPPFDLHEATSLAEAASLMTRHRPSARLVAGGTDVLVDLKTSRIKVDHLVSISGLDELRGIEERENDLRIGALTTIRELNEARLSDSFRAIHDATSRMAAPQIRTVATVGGNIASAVPCADLPPVLMVLNASVTLWSPGGSRVIPLTDFFSGPRETVIGGDEVLTTISVPRPPPRFGAAYARFALREGNAIAVAAVAASLVLDADGIIQDACLALGAVSPIPMVVDDAANVLVGRRLSDDVLDEAAEAAARVARPISDIRGSAEYRRELVGVLTRRALVESLRRAEV